MLGTTAAVPTPEVLGLTLGPVATAIPSGTLPRTGGNFGLMVVTAMAMIAGGLGIWGASKRMGATAAVRSSQSDRQS